LTKTISFPLFLKLTVFIVLDVMMAHECLCLSKKSFQNLLTCRRNVFFTFFYTVNLKKWGLRVQPHRFKVLPSRLWSPPWLIQHQMFLSVWESAMGTSGRPWWPNWILTLPHGRLSVNHLGCMGLQCIYYILTFAIYYTLMYLIYSYF